MEQWKDVQDYVGYYQVSDIGNVRRLHPATQTEIDNGIRNVKNPLAHGRNGQGRIQVTLCKDAKIKRFQVHRLVLTAFVGPCPPGHVACHNNGDFEDNRLENLRWDTRQGNYADSVAHGTAARGSKLHWSVFTDDDVRAIRASTETQTALAEHYGTSQAAISNIKRRVTWAHVE